jgi:hypothetical protein
MLASERFDARFVVEIDLFWTILPLVQPWFTDGIKDALHESLWVMVIDAQADPTEVRPIANGAPLTLICRLLRAFRAEFLRFL